MSLTDLNIQEWLSKKDKFDLIIDARSQSEFAYSHIKTAQNFYALNDKEHKEIGTIYKQNKALAKVLGARYVCLNLNTHLEAIYKKCRVGSLIGIYCARGGMRSNSIAQVLSLIGYRVDRLEGGYKAYRNYAQNSLENINLKFITLFGNTGSYKTKLIKSLNPSLNLEKLANHLGSVFGEIGGIQPSQKAFEDSIFEAINDISGSYCFIEGESRRIGTLTIPKGVYEAMRNGISIEIKASLNKRIECILDDYKCVDMQFFNQCMRKISPFISKEARVDATQAFKNGDTAKVCEILLTKYYDKVYKKPLKVDYTISADNFSEARDRLMQIYNELVSKLQN